MKGNSPGYEVSESSGEFLLKEEIRLIIEMQREFFESLPVEKIGHVCFEPMVPVYQSGMRQQSGQDAQGFRNEFYKSLLPGQRALLGFFTYYDHAIRSRDEFQRTTTLYLSGRFFAIVKKGAEYFEAESMQYLLLEIEKTFSEQNEIQNVRIDELYNRLNEIAPYTMSQIGACIKDNPTEYVNFK